MIRDNYFSSCGKGEIRTRYWIPDAAPRGIVQIVHGIVEHIERYDRFASYLNAHGFLVVGHDHMGHGKSISGGSSPGYFHGGWFAAVQDTVQLLKDTMGQYPDIPYVLFGHSMGSFIVRTVLAQNPDCGLSGAIICGTGWMPNWVLSVGKKTCNAICRLSGEEKPNAPLNKAIFGGYNKYIDRPRTEYDWLSRDARQVDAYIADPLCGFTASAGLIRDMLGGMQFVQNIKHLNHMNKQLPVHFIAGSHDPVGNSGKGVLQAADEFQKAGMDKVSCRIYPLSRHEILNEINYLEVFEDILYWLNSVLG